MTATAPATRYTDPDELTPDALERVWFSPASRLWNKKAGYDETEVDNFLDLVAERLARLMRRVAELEAVVAARSHDLTEAVLPDPDDPGLLTYEEHAAVEALGDAWNLLAPVVRGRNARDDLAEIAGHLHAVQNAVLAQAAARAYPARYRRLGERVGEPEGRVVTAPAAEFRP